MQIVKWIGLASVIFLVYAAFSGSDTEINRADYGEEYPLTIEGAHLSCADGVPHVIHQGVRYRLTGAEGGGVYKYKPLEDIWKIDPTDPQRRISAGKLIERGLALCK